MRFLLSVLGVIALLAVTTPGIAVSHEGETHVLDTSKDGMKAIAGSLGVKCGHCHTTKKENGKPDFEAPSNLKETAIFMKTHFVDVLTDANGKALTCEGCHQGKAKFIPRETGDAFEGKLSERFERRELLNLMKSFQTDLDVKCIFCHERGVDGRLDPTIPTKHRTMARYINETFGGLKMKSGEPVTCATCHGGKAEFLPRSE